MTSNLLLSATIVSVGLVRLCLLERRVKGTVGTSQTLLDTNIVHCRGFGQRWQLREI